jgi:hypothetical protein
MRFLALVLVAGCATRATPYRFESPLIGGVTAAIDTPRATVDDEDEPPWEKPAKKQPVITREDIDPMPREEPVVPQVAGLPAPHRTEAAPAEIDPAKLRALVGVRVTDESNQFAVAVAAAIAGKPAPTVSADGETLLAWMTQNASQVTDLRPGDVVYFDRAIAGRDASLWAVVLENRTVVEILFVGGGIVRRGFVDPTQPRTARDRSGRIHNTFLRFGKDWPPKGTRYLSGELLGGGFRLR